tara:strand:+ start:781 stop:957 length:177 start_codon:yes stop_codon:yes gene_type:complete
MINPIMQGNLFEEITGINTDEGEFPIRIEFDLQSTFFLALSIGLTVFLAVLAAKKIGG